MKKNEIPPNRESCSFEEEGVDEELLAKTKKLLAESEPENVLSENISTAGWMRKPIGSTWTPGLAPRTSFTSSAFGTTMSLQEIRDMMGNSVTPNHTGVLRPVYHELQRGDELLGVDYETIMRVLDCHPLSIIKVDSMKHEIHVVPPDGGNFTITFQALERRLASYSQLYPLVKRTFPFPNKWCRNETITKKKMR